MGYPSRCFIPNPPKPPWRRLPHRLAFGAGSIWSILLASAPNRGGRKNPYQRMSRWKLGSMVSKWNITYLKTGYIGVITHLLSIDPNFLGHSSSEFGTRWIPKNPGRPLENRIGFFGEPNPIRKEARNVEIYNPFLRTYKRILRGCSTLHDT